MPLLLFLVQYTDASVSVPTIINDASITFLAQYINAAVTLLICTENYINLN